MNDSIHGGDDENPTRSMKEVMSLRDTYQERLRRHAFYDWITSETLPIEQRFTFLPAMALFVMNFRDMNLWVIRFNEADDQFKEVINGSTTEDETHSRLFLEDWRKLHLDDHLGWKASDVLWWLFLSEEMETFRRSGVEFMKLSAEDNNDPLVRFAHSEAGEACGHVFFENVAPIADVLGKQRQLNYRYLGRFHLDLETGHVLESEGIFENQPLTDAQYEQSEELAVRMFGIFDDIHDSFLEYGERYAGTGKVPRAKHVHSPNADSTTSAEFSQKVALSAAPNTHPSQRELDVHLNERIDKVAQHPFFSWLTDSPLPAHQKLQRFIPLWAFDILGYRDLNRYVFRYASPADELERSVNLLATDLETHSRLFLRDWIALELDDVLRWQASQTLEFLFLDYFMDHHRRSLIQFGMLGLKHPDPLTRLWFMAALETSGHSFFQATRKVALEVEREHGVVLDYLADRHTGLHAATPSKVAPFKSLPISNDAQLKQIHRLVDVVFDALDHNLGSSLVACETNKFSVRSSQTLASTGTTPRSSQAGE